MNNKQRVTAEKEMMTGTIWRELRTYQKPLIAPHRSSFVAKHRALFFATMCTMIAVVQRVLKAGVFVDAPPHEERIEKGLCVLLGVEHGDTQKDAAWIAKKLANLRIFNDEEGRMNHSILDIGGELLLISQFTLAADCSQGNRPSFINAAKPEIAEPLVEKVSVLLQEHGVVVKNGVFGAMMRVEIENDGPVTIVIKQD